MNSFKMKNRILAVLLCLVMVGGIVIGSYFTGEEVAQASNSLPGITQLKNSGKEYTILEIVPDVSQSAFAWYVGGSEPVNAYKLSVAYQGDFSGYQTSYTNTTSMLQNQNYLLSNEENASPSASILNYLGSVSANSAGTALEGGFENNEWFLRYVLDWTEEDLMPQIKVLTVAPENVTTVHLDMADMVVLSGGFYYPDVNTSPMAYSTDVGKNLPTDVTDSLISRVSGMGSSGNMGLPLILDRRAYNTSAPATLNSNRVFHEILKSDPRNVPSGVYGSVFYFSAVSSTDEIANAIALESGGRLGLSGSMSQGFLTTPQFNQPFSSTMTGSGGTFNVVLQSIQAENATRGGVGLLSEEITMARVIRYLVGGSNMTSKVEVDTKTSVSILSIQPGNSSGIAQYQSSNHDKFGLSAPSTTAKVGLPTNSSATPQADQVSWEDLERWTGLSRQNIKVVEMTMSEFVASSVPVSGNYDLVYIGNDISSNSYGVYSETAQFSTTSQVLANPTGLTYFAPTGSQLSTPTASYQVGVNDLSAKRYKELTDFISSGRPVVIAPYLCAGLNWRPDVTAPSAVSMDSSSNIYKLLSNASGRSNVMRQDMLIVGPDGVSGTSDDSSMLETCINAVNLPTPNISVMTLGTTIPEKNGAVVKPTYTANGTAEYILSYVFQITNDTVSAGSGVSYNLSVMLDLNSDGIYETDCRLFDDLTVEQLQTNLDGTLVLNSSMQAVREQEVGLTNLKQDQYYRVSVVLPDTVSGVVPWRLSVVSSENTAVGVAEAYAMVLSATTELKVLQLTGDSYGSFNMSSYTTGINTALGSDANNSDITAVSFTTRTVSASNSDINDFDVVMVGFGDFDNLSGLSALLDTYSGTVLYYDTSLSNDASAANKLEDHVAYSESLDYVASDIESQLGSNPFAVTIDADSEWLVTSGGDFITNIAVLDTGTSSLERFLNVIVTVYNMSKETDTGTGDGGGNNTTTPTGNMSISKFSTMTPTLNGSTSPMELSKSVLNNANGTQTIYFKIPDLDINNFKVGMRFKQEGESSWRIDSASSNYDNILSDIDITATFLFAYTGGGLFSNTATEEFNFKDTVYYFGEYTNANGSQVIGDSSKNALFSLSFLPQLGTSILELDEGKNGVIEIYITPSDINSGGQETSAQFLVTATTTNLDDNMVQGQGTDYLYYKYVLDDEGDYIYDSETDRYYLDDSSIGYGQAYYKTYSTADYRQISSLDVRKGTHVLVGHDYTLVADAPATALGGHYYIYTCWTPSSSGTHYYDSGAVADEDYDHEKYGDDYKFTKIPEVEEYKGDRFRLETNMVGTDSVNGGLFVMG